jgi:hypothetical protein
MRTLSLYVYEKTIMEPLTGAIQESMTHISATPCKSMSLKNMFRGCYTVYSVASFSRGYRGLSTAPELMTLRLISAIILAIILFSSQQGFIISVGRKH